MITNRSDCCSDRLSDFEVLVDKDVIYSQKEAVGSGEELIVEVNKDGSSVTVRFSDEKELND